MNATSSFRDPFHSKPHGARAQTHHSWGDASPSRDEPRGAHSSSTLLGCLCRAAVRVGAHDIVAGRPQGLPKPAVFFPSFFSLFLSSTRRVPFCSPSRRPKTECEEPGLREGWKRGKPPACQAPARSNLTRSVWRPGLGAASSAAGAAICGSQRDTVRAPGLLAVRETMLHL